MVMIARERATNAVRIIAARRPGGWTDRWCPGTGRCEYEAGARWAAAFPPRRKSAPLAGLARKRPRLRSRHGEYAGARFRRASVREASARDCGALPRRQCSRWHRLREGLLAPPNSTG